MAPMKNSQYFQPMQHKPLPDIRKYALLTEHNEELFAVIKPVGLDVYVCNGQIYDFNHNELQNSYLNFHFEKLLQATINLKVTAIGVLVSPNQSAEVLKYRSTLYNKTRSTFNDLEFVVYDCVFPLFGKEHVYKWRFDIASKVLSILPNCKQPGYSIIKESNEIDKVVNDVFALDAKAEVMFYRADSNYSPGMSQLLYENCDVVSYKVAANQKFRAHIKRIISTTYHTNQNEKFDIALYITARFKKEFIDIPLEGLPLNTRRYIWENKTTLKDYPFWFTGYTMYVKDKDRYVTVINNFLSFIMP